MNSFLRMNDLTDEQRVFIANADIGRKHGPLACMELIQIALCAALFAIAFKPAMIAGSAANIAWLAVVVFGVFATICNPLLMREVITISRLCDEAKEFGINDEIRGKVVLKIRAYGTSIAMIRFSRLSDAALITGIAATGHMYWAAYFVFIYILLYIRLPRFVCWSEMLCEKSGSQLQQNSGESHGPLATT